MAIKTIIGPFGVEQVDESTRKPPWVPGGSECDQPAVYHRKCLLAGLPLCNMWRLCAHSYSAEYHAALQALAKRPRVSKPPVEARFLAGGFDVGEVTLEVWESDGKAVVVEKGGRDAA
jgi:hypothetical protein